MQVKAPTHRLAQRFEWTGRCSNPRLRFFRPPLNHLSYQSLTTSRFTRVDRMIAAVTKKARCSWGEGTPGQTDFRRRPIGRYGQSRVPSAFAGFRPANIASIAAIAVGRWPKPSDGLNGCRSNMVNIPVALGRHFDCLVVFLCQRNLRLHRLLDAKSAASFAQNFHFFAHVSLDSPVRQSEECDS